VAKIICFQCGADISIVGTPGRRDECAACGADVHVCKNCRHYDAKSYNECREPQAERVQEKERANFCDRFEAKLATVAAGTGAAADQFVSERDRLRAAAEALFKKK
jgi:hypothetical protein